MRARRDLSGTYSWSGGGCASPIGAIGIISLPALVLLWVMPELPAVSDKLVRRLFLAMLIVDLCLPAYYTIDLKGLPWISARRIVTFALIVVFAYAISSSSAAREQIAANLRSAKSISISALGFLIMVILSVFTSVRPPESLSQAFEVMLNWYVPFLAVLYAIRSERDILLLVRVIAVCALFVSGAAVVEFIIHQRIFVNLIPEPLLSSLIEANPVFAIFVNTPAYRLGVWRSVSIYTTPLSLGEFGAMVAPLGLFYLVHGRAFFFAGVRDPRFSFVSSRGILLRIARRLSRLHPGQRHLHRALDSADPAARQGQPCAGAGRLLRLDRICGPLCADYFLGASAPYGAWRRV